MKHETCFKCFYRDPCKCRQWAKYARLWWKLQNLTGYRLHTFLWPKFVWEGHTYRTNWLTGKTNWTPL